MAMPDRAVMEQARERMTKVARAGARVVIAYHGDADGTSSGALVAAAVERLGGSMTALSPDKGDNIHGPRFAEAVRRARPDLVVVLDTGSRPERPFGEVPTIIVDHHRADSAPPVEAFVSTFGSEELVSTSALAHALVAPLAPLADRAWLAAIGMLGDLGDRARAHPLVEAAAAAHGITKLRTVVALVNAAGRSARHEVGVAFDALSEVDGPRALVHGESPAAARLSALRAEVAASLQRGRRVAPRIVGRWAIVELDDPCRIHGVIAEAWTGRLADRIVLVANLGYVAGRVHFAVRSRAPLDLRAELRALLPDGGPDFAAGHDRATGGIVDRATFDRLMDAIERQAKRRAA